MISTIFHNKGLKIATQMDLRQNRVSSEQNMYPSPAKLYTSAARTSRNIFKVCYDVTPVQEWSQQSQEPQKMTYLLSEFDGYAHIPHNFSKYRFFIAFQIYLRTKSINNVQTKIY